MCLSSSLVMLSTRGANYLHNTLVWPPTELAAARGEGEEALALARDIHWPSGEAFALIYLAYSLGAEGDYAPALRYAQEALQVATGIEHSQWLLVAHFALGLLYLDLLVWPVGQAHLEQAFEIANKFGSRFTIHVATGLLASSYVAQHQLKQAEALLEAAIDEQTAKRTLAQRLMWAARAELA